MTADDIINAISPQLNDDTRSRWTVATLIQFINNGQRAIVATKPEANTVMTSVQLVAGTRQSLPATAYRLIEVTRNMGSDGNTAGKPITVIDRETLDRFRPGWRSEQGATNIKHFLYDEQMPRIYDVYPPVHSVTPVYVEIAHSAAPTNCTTGASNLGIPDMYATALQQWVLYEAFAVNTSPTSMARSQAAMRMFATLMGLKGVADVATSPNTQTKPGAQ